MKRTLKVLFILSVVMGCGPGLYLVNPDPTDPDSLRTILGVPIIYAWGLFWVLIEAGVLVIACCTIWARECREE